MAWRGTTLMATPRSFLACPNSAIQRPASSPISISSSVDLRSDPCQSSTRISSAPPAAAYVAAFLLYMANGGADIDDTARQYMRQAMTMEESVVVPAQC
jgi:hypothetical protein